MLRHITSRLGAFTSLPRATLHRKRLFHSDEKLDLLLNTTFELVKNYQLILQAWAFFPNHYHLIVSFENSATRHTDFLRHLHRELAIDSTVWTALLDGE
jgi:hypothetical protein